MNLEIAVRKKIVNLRKKLVQIAVNGFNDEIGFVQTRNQLMIENQKLHIIIVNSLIVTDSSYLMSTKT